MRFDHESGWKSVSYEALTLQGTDNRMGRAFIHIFDRTAFVPRLPEYVVQSAAKLPKKVLRRVKFRASRLALTAAARYGSDQRRRGSPL